MTFISELHLAIMKVNKHAKSEENYIKVSRDNILKVTQRQRPLVTLPTLKLCLVII